MNYRQVTLGLFIAFQLVTNYQILNARSRKPITVENVEFVYRTENDFKGISEALTGRENTGGRFFIRGETEKREGGYFRVCFDRSVQMLPLNGTLTIYFFTDFTPLQQTQEWRLTVPSHSVYAELYARVDDKANLPQKIQLLAWYAVLKDAKGKIISETKSFAWEMPTSVPRRFLMKK